MDVIGAITPKASNGHEFILVAIDYFTRWVVACLFKNVTQVAVTRFVKHNIICRYGMLEMLIIDNASNLNNRMIVDTGGKIIHILTLKWSFLFPWSRAPFGECVYDLYLFFFSRYELCVCVWEHVYVCACEHKFGVATNHGKFKVWLGTYV